MITSGVPAKAPSPRLVAAWAVLDLVPAERLPWWAADWLAAGRDGVALRELAGLGAHEPREARDLLPDVLTELAEPIPTRIDAAVICFDHIARRCLEGAVDEQTVVALVDGVLERVDFAEEVYEFPLAGAFGVDGDWTDEDSTRAAELRVLVRDCCAAQLAHEEERRHRAHR